ncbi:MAG: DNA polymerase III subunit gamma/tau [Lachnospiraceae bacterium]|nr:DNA polymerase III subunit gamma/tau [Lachnospiraceae bacterium]
MGYTALYRKFRPQVFDDVKGQDHIVTTLRNQIVANRIGHAFLFCGTRGVGKTTAAKIFARAVNCENPTDGNPCGECPTCKAILAGTSMNVIEIDAASNNGVDNIREIIDEVQYSPTEGKYKVYIIDEVHMLSAGAFNALLKTLEEPPSYVIFILATTEIHKIPITILSRCQRYDFRRATAEGVASRLKTLCDTEGVQAEEKALRYIAVKADGSFRDGISLLDQCISFYLGQELTYDKVLEVLGTVDTTVFGQLMSSIREGNVSQVLAILDDAVMHGRELTQFTVDFTWYLRNLLVAKAQGSADDVLDIPSDYLPIFMKEVEANSAETISRYIRIMSDLTNDIRFSTQKRVLVEVTLIKLCKPETESTTDAVNERIERLEEKLANGSISVNVSATTTGAYTAKEEPEPEPVLTRALPEELQEIARKWPKILHGFNSMGRENLAGAKVSVTDDNRLLLVFTDAFSYGYVTDDPDGIENIKAAIAKETGKIVDVELKKVGSNKEAKGFPDLQKLFKDIPIEVE